MFTSCSVTVSVAVWLWFGPIVPRQQISSSRRDTSLWGSRVAPLTNPLWGKPCKRIPPGPAHAVRCYLLWMVPRSPPRSWWWSWARPPSPSRTHPRWTTRSPPVRYSLISFFFWSGVPFSSTSSSSSELRHKLYIFIYFKSWQWSLRCCFQTLTTQKYNWDLIFYSSMIHLIFNNYK